MVTSIGFTLTRPIVPASAIAFALTLPLAAEIAPTPYNPAERHAVTQNY